MNISESLFGVKGLKQIKIGWIADPEEIKEQLGKLSNQASLDLVLLQIRNVELTEGVKGCFFLRKHSSEEFYYIVPWNPMISNHDAAYDDEVSIVKNACEMIREPMKSLKAEKRLDRFRAAVLLSIKYASRGCSAGYCGGKKLVELSEKESKLILEALLEGDWTDTDPYVGPVCDAVIQGMNGVFRVLKLPEPKYEAAAAPKKGDNVFHSKQKFKLADPDKHYRACKEAYRDWLKNDGEHYRIKKWVASDEMEESESGQ